jgi:hypothetical protein
MARAAYVPEDFGKEVAAPSGYYLPLEEVSIEYNGKRLLYILGSACIEASCCGTGSWKYVRVEGYVVENDPSQGQSDGVHPEVDTIESSSEGAAISELLLEKHPGARIEFR